MGYDARRRLMFELKLTPHSGGRGNADHGRTLLSVSWISILLTTVLLCGASLGYGQNPKNKKDKNKNVDTDATALSLLPDNSAIDLLVTQMLGAWQAGDADAMHKFYADDVAVVSGGWEPPLFGWTNYAAAYRAQMAQATGSRLERTNSFIKVMGDTAWVTYQWQYTGNVGGKLIQAFGHTTLVLQKRAGTWLIVLNHTSAIPTDTQPAQTSTAPADGRATSSFRPDAN